MQAKLDSDRGPRRERRKDLKRTVAQFALLDSELKLLPKLSNDSASIGRTAENDSADRFDACSSWIPDTLVTSLIMASREGIG